MWTCTKMIHDWKTVMTVSKLPKNDLFTQVRVVLKLLKSGEKKEGGGVKENLIKKDLPLGFPTSKHLIWADEIPNPGPGLCYQTLKSLSGREKTVDKSQNIQFKKRGKMCLGSHNTPGLFQSSSSWTFLPQSQIKTFLEVCQLGGMCYIN